jgi:Spy/CpxP family protein refolding chaperone
MRKSWRWKTIFGLMAIFGVGFVSGGITSLMVVYKMITRPEPVKHWADQRLKDLEARLQLTAEQKAKIEPLVQDAGGKFREIGARSFGEITTLARATQERISQELTPEQREKFAKLDKPVLAKVTEWAQKEITVKSREVIAPDMGRGR